MARDVYSFRITPEYVERLRRAAGLAGVKPSALVRRWVIERLEETPNEGEAIARRVARDLREVFGERLVRVILFGSWARDDAGDDSDVDLLVVLQPMGSRHAERMRMYEVVGDHFLRAGRAISAIPVDAGALAEADSDLLRSALAEGKDVFPDAA